MAARLKVDPVDLHMVRDHIVVAGDDHATASAGHVDELSDAVSRWRGGSSRLALQEVADRWEARNADLRARVDALGRNVSEAAHQYAAADSESGQAIESVPTLGTDSTSGSVPDLGL